MSTVTTAYGSSAGSVVLLGLRDKLVASLVEPVASVDTPVDKTFVRIVAKPSPTIAKYRAEKGIALRFPAPEPDTNAGAGRYGMMVTRVLECYVYTQNLSDPAGEDEVSALKHLDFEETIINVLVDARPVDLQVAGERIGVKVRFLPGGSALEREVKADPGLSFSVLLFEVTYQLPFLVLRD